MSGYGATRHIQASRSEFAGVLKLMRIMSVVRWRDGGPSTAPEPR